MKLTLGFLIYTTTIITQIFAVPVDSVADTTDALSKLVEDGVVDVIPAETINKLTDFITTIMSAYENLIADSADTITANIVAEEVADQVIQNVEDTTNTADLTESTPETTSDTTSSNISTSETTTTDTANSGLLAVVPKVIGAATSIGGNVLGGVGRLLG